MRHHAFVIEAEAEEGIKVARQWQEQELGMQAKTPSTLLGVNNPDIVELRYGLFTVEDARRVNEIAMQAPLYGSEKVIIIAAARMYHESQNALLKLFEEPAEGVYLFLILPLLGGLLPTLRSRVQILKHEIRSTKLETNFKSQKSKSEGTAEEFIKMSKEERTAMIKKLATGRDDDERRENRDKAIALINCIEAMVYTACEGQTFTKQQTTLLSDIATLRGYMYDRSAPVKMILEHISMMTAGVRGKL